MPPLRDDDPEVREALAYLASFTDFEQLAAQRPGRSTFDLSRMDRLLARMDAPHRSVPVVHIAGTKGKTSTTYLVDALLRAHGLRTFRFVSPHVETVRERLAVDGAPVDPATFVALVDALRPHVEHARAHAPKDVPSFFESMTLMGFLLARRAAVDVSVFEVGLGGRLDATNVVDPAIALLLPIGLDHTRILGDTLEKIAAEKAGILKPGRPAATSVSEDSAAYPVFVERARELGVPLAVLGRDFAVTAVTPGLTPDGGPCLRLSVTLGPDETLTDLAFAAGATHQADNAALALYASRAVVGRPLEEEACRAALRALRIPARAEWFPRCRTLLDGAHTVESVAGLHQVLARMAGDGPLVVVCGITKDRDAAKILGPLARDAADVITAPLPSPRGQDPRVLARALREVGVVARAADDPRDAWSLARELAGRGGLVVVVGSLYLAGAIRPLLTETEARI